MLESYIGAVESEMPEDWGGNLLNDIGEDEYNKLQEVLESIIVQRYRNYFEYNLDRPVEIDILP